MVVRKELWNEIRELVLEEYRESHNLLGIIRAVVENCVQYIEDAAVSLQGVASVENASGEWLDLLGKIVGLERNPGESDESFRSRILEYAKVNNAGTIDYLISNAIDKSGDPAPQYMDEVPLTFFVYTPNGRQLLRSTVKRLAPAGVLGLPGAAVEMGDGSLLADANGKLFLMVAEDSHVGESYQLVTEEGESILTETGENLVTE
ncbi:DUF2612 domain-containing protein [Fibrobacter sp. UWH4]|uniref:DUF2612 domain-containing protein n=1 Tax=Fibrobacter sp. UWH4 TaxID=1896210 RepID=UPI00090F159F|nr:DUF2612 domain-containing protein [Fibrobacter sp. UWH4]SHL04401.1 Protein of unknown function [Fibrobacter sp. UWH4]